MRGGRVSVAAERYEESKRWERAAENSGHGEAQQGTLLAADSHGCTAPTKGQIHGALCVRLGRDCRRAVGALASSCKTWSTLSPIGRRLLPA